ncbi:hypothetical protein [Streptomyces violaceusniger]|uniref:Uncharacterized protein n=1 Tax=Streptomyces violaceusniger (strain Tu 4113) TaxID=653045 RepID=G2NZL6_STRV4|nr:hypothetical protein [Streptomyces violaceusniger]AEM83639.1 hypothetical protein Strvi_3980 [Streptomyces violaceusniger Tu 4113]
MATGRSVRAGGVLPRLLLVVVLALGVFVMHTLGHPDGGSGAGGSHSAHHASGEPRPAPDGGDRDGGTAATGSGSHRATPASSAEAGHAPAAPKTKPRAPMTGMDMASLCVAVLGVWVLGALLSAALARRSVPPLRLPVASVVVARPDPPSHGPDLTALSVLRI